MNEKKRRLKDVELKLLSELMKNSRRSDREIAKAIGVSQPTVSRILAKLEKEGFIRNYSAILDFVKVGYSILAITFVKLKSGYSDEELEKARKMSRDRIEQSQFDVVMLERGMGLGFDACIISMHKDYSEFSRLQSAIKSFPFVESSKIENFIINLEDPVRYHPLSFQTVAKHLAAPEKSK
jgi:DNA-binding Lrp family transcriptional regulator